MARKRSGKRVTVNSSGLDPCDSVTSVRALPGSRAWVRGGGWSPPQVSARQAKGELQSSYKS